MTCPLCSTGITPLHRYYGAVRPCPAHQYFQPHGFHRLCLFPWHRRSGSQVPHKSPDESHASYTPDTTWPVSRSLPRSSWNKGTAPVLMSVIKFSMRHQRFACARLSHPYLTCSLPRLLTTTFTTAALTEAARGGLKPSPTGRLRRAFLHLSCSMTLARLLDTMPLFLSRLWPYLASGQQRPSM
jgi:hypothetical protein